MNCRGMCPVLKDILAASTKRVRSLNICNESAWELYAADSSWPRQAHLGANVCTSLSGVCFQADLIHQCRSVYEHSEGHDLRKVYPGFTTTFSAPATLAPRSSKDAIAAFTRKGGVTEVPSSAHTPSYSNCVTQSQGSAEPSAISIASRIQD